MNSKHIAPTVSGIALTALAAVGMTVGSSHIKRNIQPDVIIQQLPPPAPEVPAPQPLQKKIVNDPPKENVIILPEMKIVSPKKPIAVKNEPAKIEVSPTKPTLDKPFMCEETWHDSALGGQYRRCK